MSQKGANDILQSKMPSFIRLCLLLLIILFSQCYCDGRSVPSLRDRKKPPLVVPWRQYSEHRKQPIEALLSGLARASKQIGVHLSCAPGPFGGVSRILCLSGAAALYSYNRSEAAQRACYFWKKAGPIGTSKWIRQ